MLQIKIISLSEKDSNKQVNDFLKENGHLVVANGSQTFVDKVVFFFETDSSVVKNLEAKADALKLGMPETELEIRYWKEMLNSLVAPNIADMPYVKGKEATEEFERRVAVCKANVENGGIALNEAEKRLEIIKELIKEEKKNG